VWVKHAEFVAPRVATQVAEWAGHSVEVLLSIYAKCIDGRDQVWFDPIDSALGDGKP